MTPAEEQSIIQGALANGYTITRTANPATAKEYFTITDSAGRTGTAPQSIGFAIALTPAQMSALPPQAQGQIFTELRSLHQKAAAYERPADSETTFYGVGHQRPTVFGSMIGQTSGANGYYDKGGSIQFSSQAINTVRRADDIGQANKGGFFSDLGSGVVDYAKMIAPMVATAAGAYFGATAIGGMLGGGGGAASAVAPASLGAEASAAAGKGGLYSLAGQGGSLTTTGTSGMGMTGGGGMGLTAGQGATLGSGAGLAGATTTTGIGSSLANIFKNADGSFNLENTARIGSTLLGAYQANQDASGLRDAQAANLASDNAWRERGFQMGEPYRQKLTDLYADPNKFMQSDQVQVPVQRATDMLSRSLSLGGNPIGSGNALQELQNSATKGMWGAYGEEKDRLAGFGGLTAYNTTGASRPASGQYIPNQALNQLQAGFGDWAGEQSRERDRLANMSLWNSYPGGAR